MPKRIDVHQCEGKRSAKNFNEHTEAEFAQAGAVASADISLLAGQFPAELHLHGAMEPQLRNLGMPTRLENAVSGRGPGQHFEAVRPPIAPIPRPSARSMEQKEGI
ncbi:hypothetical protein niasHT_016065 [Heterodera trifolii]|uniref:Uncharacterized protein n=1 Tax=Heterodera trifolii TaxID=157864 RepID=A0ABD2LB68_9BILA